MQPPSDQQKLDQARALLQQQQFDQARPILESMPNNPTAREWLNFMNQNQPMPPSGPPSGPPAGPPPGYAPPPPPAAPVNLPPNLPLAFRQEFRWGVAGLGIVLGIIILFLFFFTPLIDGNNFDNYVDAYRDALEYESRNADRDWQRDEARWALEDIDAFMDGDYEELDSSYRDVDLPTYNDIDVSAWQVWIGKAGSLAVKEGDLDYKGNFTLSGSEVEDTYRALEGADSDDEVRDIIDDFGGFSGVRSIDRLLIIYPIGAILIAVMGILAALNITQLRPALITMGVTLLVLFGFIFIWQSASTSNWQGSIEDQIERELDNTYDWQERAAIRAYYSIGLDEGANYIGKAYNTGGIKFFSGLGLLLVLGTTIFVWTTERQHPQISAQFRQIQMQMKAQKAYQKQQAQFMQQPQAPYGAPPPQPMPPMQQQPPATPPPPPPPPSPPPTGDAEAKDDWTTPQS